MGNSVANNSNNVNEEEKHNDDKTKGATKLDHLELVISGSRDRTIRIWNCLNGMLIYTMTGHDNWVRGLDLH